MEKDQKKKKAFDEAKKKFSAYATANVDFSSHFEPEEERVDFLEQSISLQESGEWEDTLRDIQYNLDGVKNSRLKLSIRRSCALSLAKACQSRNTRMLLRACPDESMAQLFQLVQTVEDSKDPSLELAVLAIIYYLTLDFESVEQFTSHGFEQVVQRLNLICTRQQVNDYDAKLGCNRANSTPHVLPTTKKQLKRKKKNDDGKRFIKQFFQLFPIKGSGSSNNEDAIDSNSLIFLGIIYEYVQQLNNYDADHHLYDDIMVNFILVILDRTLELGSSTVASAKIEYQNKDAAFLTERKMIIGATKRKKIICAHSGLSSICLIIQKAIFPLDSTLSNRFVGLDFFRLLYCLKYLEQASFIDDSAQDYLVRNTALIKNLLKLLDVVSKKTSVQENGKEHCFQSINAVSCDIVLFTLRVLINLTNGNEVGCQAVADLKGMDGLFEVFLRLNSSSFNRNFDETRKKYEFDSVLLILSLLTNCVEKNDDNRKSVLSISLSKLTDTFRAVRNMKNESICGFLVRLFLKKTESYSDMLLSSSININENEDWSVEDLLLAGCICLLLGYLMKESSYVTAIVLGALPNGSSKILLRVLEAFVALHSQIGIVTQDVIVSVLEIMKDFQKLLPLEEQDSFEIEKSLSSFSDISDSTNTSCGDSLLLSQESLSGNIGSHSQFSNSTIHSLGSSFDQELESIRQNIQHSRQESDVSVDCKDNVSLCTPLKKRPLSRQPNDENEDVEAEVVNSEAHIISTPPASAFTYKSFRKGSFGCETLDADCVNDDEEVYRSGGDMFGRLQERLHKISNEGIDHSTKMKHFEAVSIPPKLLITKKKIVKKTSKTSPSKKRKFEAVQNSSEKKPSVYDFNPSEGNTIKVRKRKATSKANPGEQSKNTKYAVCRTTCTKKAKRKMNFGKLVSKAKDDRLNISFTSVGSSVFDFDG